MLTRLKTATAVIALPFALLVSSGTASAADSSAGSATKAQSTLATCLSSHTVNYSPGLLLTPQQVTISASTQYTACLGGGVSSGSSTSNPPPQSLSCLNLGEPASGTETITWNDGTTSTYSYNQTVVDAGAVSTVTRTGSISAGKFAGATAVRVITNPNLEVLDCLAPPGVTSKSGLGDLTILSA
ncbi:hypothetical protein [Streptomyces sp. NPDC002640]